MKNTGQFKKGQLPWNTGTHLSGMKGKHHSKSSREKIGKSNKKVNPISPVNDLIRRSSTFKEWRAEVFKRDNWTCQICGAKRPLHPHHIKSFSEYPELRFEVSNGQTLCESCHGKIHNIDFKGYHRNLTCAVCKKVFKARDGQYKQQTCSKKCGYALIKSRGSSKKGRHYPHLQRARVGKCLVCGTEYRAVTDTINRHQKYCSRECYLKARWNFTGRQAERIDGTT